MCQKSVSCIVPLSCNTQELYQQLLWLFLMLKIILGSAGGGKYVDVAVAGQYHYHLRQKAVYFYLLSIASTPREAN